MGAPEEDQKKGSEKILEEILVKNFPNMGKEIVTQVQEVESPIQNTSKEKHTDIHINQTNQASAKERSAWLPQPRAPEGRLRSALQLHHHLPRSRPPSLPSRCRSRGLSPGSFLRASSHPSIRSHPSICCHPSIRSHPSICCQATWRLCHSLAGELWLVPSVSTADVLVHERTEWQCLPRKVWERNKLVHSDLSEQCPWTTSIQWMPTTNYYYECIFLPEKFSIRSEFTGVPWWPSR